MREVVQLLFHAKALRREGMVAVCDTLHAISEGFTSKIHKQPQGLLHQSQVCEQLLCMDRSISLDRFYFNDEHILDHQISSKRIRKCHSPKCDWHCPLLLNEQTSLPQGGCEHIFINRFQESRSELLMNMESTVDRGCGEILNSGHGTTSRLCAFA